MGFCSCCLESQEVENVFSFKSMNYAFYLLSISQSIITKRLTFHKGNSVIELQKHFKKLIICQVYIVLNIYFAHTYSFNTLLLFVLMYKTSLPVFILQFLNLSNVTWNALNVSHPVLSLCDQKDIIVSC